MVFLYIISKTGQHGILEIYTQKFVNHCILNESFDEKLFPFFVTMFIISSFVLYKVYDILSPGCTLSVFLVVTWLAIMIIFVLGMIISFTMTPIFRKIAWFTYPKVYIEETIYGPKLLIRLLLNKYSDQLKEKEIKKLKLYLKSVEENLERC